MSILITKDFRVYGIKRMDIDCVIDGVGIEDILSCDWVKDVKNWYVGKIKGKKYDLEVNSDRGFGEQFFMFNLTQEEFNYLKLKLI